MGDLSELLSSGSTKIVGANASGIESNFAQVDSNGNVLTNLRNSSGSETGVVGTPLRVDPTGTTAQPITDNGGSLTVDGTVTALSGISSGGVYGALTMTTAGIVYEARVGGTPLANRSLLVITPTTADIWWGLDTSVTTSSGTPIFRNQTATIDLHSSSAARIYLVSTSNSVNVRIIEAP